MSLSHFAVALCLVLSSATALAQTNARLSFGALQYTGDGCDESSLSSALSPDASALSLLFSNFAVETDATHQIARKACNLAIPVDVPDGLQAAIIGVDYRGFNDLPAGAAATLTVAYSIPGASSAPHTMLFEGPLSDTYVLEERLDVEKPLWTGCGSSTLLRINNALVVSARNSSDIAYAAVDSIETTANNPNATSGMMFYLNWQNCTTNAGAAMLPIIRMLAAIAAFIAL
jgi:hypothetical protein